MFAQLQDQEESLADLEGVDQGNDAGVIQIAHDAQLLARRFAILPPSSMLVNHFEGVLKSQTVNQTVVSSFLRRVALSPSFAVSRLLGSL